MGTEDYIVDGFTLLIRQNILTIDASFYEEYIG